MTPELAEKVTLLPRHYGAEGKSTAALLSDAGFPEAQGNLSVDQIEQVLRHKPDLVDLWFNRRSDQRIAGGWGIESDAGEYRVHSFSGSSECLHFEDRFRACAEFIVRYVSFICQHLRPKLN